MHDLKDSMIGFIGGGNMSTSLITGMTYSGVTPKNIIVADPNLAKRQSIEKLGVNTTESDSKVAESADILILAVKPKDMKAAIDEIKRGLKSHPTLVISIAAGILTETLERWLGINTAIVRAMPNTAALLRAGATALYANTRVTDKERSLAESILRGVGVTVWVAHEHEMDTVTALSGSGPAYFFLMMKALEEGAERLNLPSETAKMLTLQTALGAARMALESEIPMEALIQRVASKGGTTEAALTILENSDFNNIMKAALKGARDRSQEISRHFDQE